MSDFVTRGRHPADPTGERMGDQHWPLPDRYSVEPTMNVAINRETMTFIGLGEYRVIWAKALKEAVPEAIVIGAADVSRTYSAFTDLELKLLYRNTTGFQHEGFDYNALLQSCKALAMQLEPMPTPPELYRSPVVATTHAPTSSKTPPTRSKRGPATPGPRPPSTTATGRVWDIADRVAADEPGSDPKVLRAAILAACVAVGINPATAQVQYGKWKAARKTPSGD